MPGGRPSKYCPEIIEKAQHYVDNYGDYGDPVPSVAALACEIGLSRDTVWQWSKDDQKPEFSDIVVQLMATQERKLSGGSLLGELNPTIAKLMLTKHGYSERVQNELTGADGGPIESNQKVEFNFIPVGGDDSD